MTVPRGAAAQTGATLPGRRRLAEARASYDASVERVGDQLAEHVSGRPEPPGVLVVLPAVGFGDQSAGALPHALRTLADQRVRHCDAEVVVLVNRPVRKLRDGTVDRALAALPADAADGAPRFAVCEVELEQRPRIGELRQLAVDASAHAHGAVDDDAAVVIADDDVVAMPPGTLEHLAIGVRREADLVLGSVLFDDPAMPLCLWVALWVADLLRGLLAARLLEALGPGRPTGVPHRWAGQALGVPAPDPGTFESLVLAGNVGVSHGALARAGGFRDLNEVTGMIRDLVQSGASVCARPPHGAHADPVIALLDGSVRMSSRRAMAAWRTAGQPTVAQWRVCRLRSSRPDPVRLAQGVHELPRPVQRWGRTEREQSLEGLAAALAITLDHLDPPHDLALWALQALGIEEGDRTLSPPSEGSAGWGLVLHRDAGLLERADHLQRHELTNRIGVQRLGTEAAR